MADTIVIKIKIDADPSKAKKVAEGLEDIGDAAKKAKGPLDEIVTGGLRQIGALATNAMGQAAGALLSFGKGSLDAAANFEDAMGDVAAISGATGDDFNALRDTALQLGKETAFSASEAASGMKLLAQAGFTVNETMDAMPGLLSAAAAGGVDLATAADVVSSTLRGFGLAAEDSAHVADVLAMAANRSNADMTSLGESMKYVAPVAATLGISMEDATAAIGRMHDAGIKGSMAGTALRGILTRLAAPTDKARAEMDRLGISVFDAEGKMLPIPELVGHMSERLEGLTDSQRTAAVATMVGQEAMSGFLALTKAGPENLQEFSDALVNSGGAAAEVAAIQLADFNGAVEAMGGSFETFQIMLMSRALPALAGFINDGVIPAINAGTDMVDPFLDFVGVLSTGFVPALTGAAIAAGTYALIQGPALIVAAQGATTAFLAQAAAVAAAVGPFVVLAAGVAAVAWAVNDFEQKTESATQKLLESREWWNASTTAIDQYEASLVGASPVIDNLAGTITRLRGEIEAEVQSLGQRMAAGQVSDEQYATEMAAINAKSETLQAATGYLNAEVEALNAQTAASMTATEQLAAMGEGHAALTPLVQLTIEEIEALGKHIQDTYRQGGEALAAYTATEVDFLAGVQERRVTHEDAMTALIAEREAAKTAEQRAAIDERIAAEQEAYVTQETNAATAYSEQQAAQRAHLGSMLLEYTNAQIQLGNITAEKGAEITAALVTEYGIQENTAASTFASMAAAIDEYASGSSESIDSLIGDLRANESAAVETEQAMTDMAKEYRADAVANFVERKGEASDYAATLRGIPSRVNTEVHTRYTESGNGPRGSEGTGGSRGGNQGQRALGGPVNTGVPYLVGESGPEMFIPRQDGQVVTAAETARMLRDQTLPGAEAMSGGMRVAVMGEIHIRLSMTGDLQRWITATVDQQIDARARSANNRRLAQ